MPPFHRLKSYHHKSFSVYSMHCSRLPLHASVWLYFVVLPVCDPTITVCVSHCPACPVAPINPKTHLGSPWSNQNPRRRKPPPLPLPAWQHLPIQALCPLSKGKAPDPARPLRLPTHSTRRMTRKKITRWRKKRGLKVVQCHPRLWLVTHGTASPGLLTRQVDSLHLVEEARPVLPAQGAPRARNGRHLALRSHLQATKVSLTSIIFDQTSN